jgi:hypothetical protein
LLEYLVAQPGVRDPRFFLHLAGAHRQADSKDACGEALARARTLGLAKVFLTSAERDELAQLDRWLGPEASTP